ncbi:MAG: membrane dipeptidase [Verrucomicrobia bacterium]|nr:membrane dipeptidase [Verrucomicrobiota bacterium]
MNLAILKLHRAAAVVLGYVNPGLIYRHHPDGVSAHDFIAGRPGCGQGTVWRMRKGGVDLVVLSHGNIDPKRFPDSAEVDYHVGIGSDYDLGDTCGGVETADKLPNLTAELVRRGYRQEEIRKILGGNFLRVFRQCQCGPAVSPARAVAGT